MTEIPLVVRGLITKSPDIDRDLSELSTPQQDLLALVNTLEINPREASPEQPNPTSSENNLLGETPLKVIVIDVGSTGLKIGAAYFGEGDLSVAMSNIWKDWSSYSQVLEIPGYPPFRYVSSQKLNELGTYITETVADVKETLQGGKHAPIVLAETGFTNSLVITYKGESVMLLDGPSAHLTTIPESITTIMSEHNTTKDPKELRILSIMKLLTVKQQEELLAELFHTDSVSFEDVQFNSMLGHVTDLFRPGVVSSGFPIADAKGLGSPAFLDKNNIDKVHAFLSDLGVTPRQLFINDEPMVATFENNVAAIINDWVAEADLMGEQRRRGIYPHDAVIVACDTVAKLMSAELEFVKLSSSAKEHYTTQRVAGGVNLLWMKYMYPTAKGTIDFGHVNAVLEECLDNNVRCTEFYYDPDDTSDNQDHGGLWMRTDEGLVMLEPTDLGNLTEHQKQQAVLAICEGVFFALRKKIDDVRGTKPFPPVVTYGGFISNGLRANEKLFRAAFPENIVVKKFEVDGLLPLARIAVQNTGRHVKSINAQIWDIPNDTSHSREEEYVMWCAQRAAIQRN